MTDVSSDVDLAALQEWFAAYCASFRSSDAEVQRNFDLKELHTRKVCEAAGLIAQGGSPRRLLLAGAAALCHDLGRFPQYRDFGTFRDSDSLNHAHLSAQILEQNDLLSFLSPSERKSVLHAVRLHNVFEVPCGLAPEADDLLKVLRDADKLDIWRIFIEYYHAPEAARASGAGLGFPDLPECSAAALAAIGSGKMVQLSVLKSLNDFKLLQLSWVYDINFLTTLRLVKEKEVLEKLAATLPREAAVLDALARVHDYLERRLGGL